MAIQASQDLNELREQREKLRQELASFRVGGDSSTRQMRYKSADSFSETAFDDVDSLRNSLAEIEARIIEMERENEAAADDPVTNDPPTIPLEELADRHGTRLSIARTERPFLLPVNAMVLPVGVQGGMQGGLSQAIRHELGEDTWQTLRSHVQTAVSTITPETPVLITLPPTLGQTILPNAPERPHGDENGRYQIIAATPARHNSDELDSGAAAAAIIKLACANQMTQVALPLLGSGRAGLESEKVAQEMLKVIYNTLPEADNPLQQVILTTRPTDHDDKSKVITAAQNIIALLIANRAQKFISDKSSGKDELGIEKEVFALAETLLLRDVETPLAVGVLGGWGSGKSFVMYLMLQRMMQLRSRPITQGWDAGEEELYVGHVYPIEFNAWTYAKSDLWASLMQTIFMELNKQLTMEQLIGKELLLAGSYWLELSQYDEKEREALQSEVGQEAIKNAQEKWQQGKAPDSLWQAYDEVRSAETASMRANMAERTVKQALLEDLNHQLEIEKIETIPQQARKEVWQEIITTAVFSEVAKEIQDNLKETTYRDENNVEQKVFTERDLEDLGKLSIKLKQYRPTISKELEEQSFADWWKEQKSLLFTAGLLLTVAILVPAVAAALNLFAQSATMASLTTFLAGISSVAMALFRTYQPWIDKIQRWNDGISSVVNLADEMLTNKEQQIIAQKEVELVTQRRKLEKEIEDLNQEITQHQQRLGIAGEFTSLHDFVTSRLAMGDYKERLGMLHQTQTDLQELTNTLMIHDKNDLFAEQKKGFFPRGPARVVLFVDDLDRCPPPKVVEVLEAVQLLLRTKLFVIVLGLDTRYVTRALEKEYAGILTRMGDPSGLDYIEKIIQIPYRVRPIEPESLRNFLESQMEIDTETTPTTPEEDEKTAQTETAVSPPHSPQTQQATDPVSVAEQPTQTAKPALKAITPQTVKFDQGDFAVLENSCLALGLTPRSIKRLINVLKLIKVFWFRTNQNKNPQETRTVINLLTLSARHPEIMADVFHSIEMAYSDKEKRTEPLKQFLIPSLGLGKTIPDTQQIAFKTAVTTLDLDDITLAELGLETFHVIRSFSFVGDPTYD
ncbi:MAG: hypothetical protein IAF02_00355 [Anaerolineae bacterium]|nr:hypothetical protein [Anaerolineae bacterium]